MEPTPRKFTLKHVVEIASLDQRTTRYVLESAEKLKFHQVRRGQHRRFSVDDATRLANCTRLIMFGVPLSTAQEIVLWCDHQVGRRQHDAPFLYAAPVTRPWEIRVINGRYVQVWQEPKGKPTSIVWDPDEYFDVTQERRIMLDELDASLPVVFWSVTHLVRLFEIATKAAAD